MLSASELKRPLTIKQYLDKTIEKIASKIDVKENTKKIFMILKCLERSNATFDSVLNATFLQFQREIGGDSYKHLLASCLCNDRFDLVEYITANFPKEVDPFDISQMLIIFSQHGYSDKFYQLLDIYIRNIYKLNDEVLYNTAIKIFNNVHVTECFGIAAALLDRQPSGQPKLPDAVKAFKVLDPRIQVRLRKGICKLDKTKQEVLNFLDNFLPPVLVGEVNNFLGNDISIPESDEEVSKATEAFLKKRFCVKPEKLDSLISVSSSSALPVSSSSSLSLLSSPVSISSSLSVPSSSSLSLLSSSVSISSSLSVPSSSSLLISASSSSSFQDEMPDSPPVSKFRKRKRN